MEVAGTQKGLLPERRPAGPLFEGQEPQFRIYAILVKLNRVKGRAQDSLNSAPGPPRLLRLRQPHAPQKSAII
jgi:hypothetical protein